MADIAGIARALGDETRVRMLAALGERSLCVCELVALTELGQPAVSHHLGVLESAGLVVSVRDGRWVNYRLVSHAPSRFAAEALRAVATLDEQDGEVALVRQQARCVDRANLTSVRMKPT